MDNLRNIVVKEENRERIEEAIGIANRQSIDDGSGMTNTISAQDVFDAVETLEKYFRNVPKCFWNGLSVVCNPNADEDAEDYVIATHFKLEYRCNCWHLYEAWRSGFPEHRFSVSMDYRMMDAIEQLVYQCKFPEEVK